jgi:hypothetical protein
MTAQKPLVNGNEYSFASIELNIKGTLFTAVKSIQYDGGLEPGKVYGTGVIALAHTRGTYEASASIEVYRGDFEKLTALLGDGFGEVTFEITVVYAEKNRPTITDRLPAVRIMKPAMDNSQGSDALTVKLDLTVLDQIEYNGKTLVKRDS